MGDSGISSVVFLLETSSWRISNLSMVFVILMFAGSSGGLHRPDAGLLRFLIQKLGVLFELIRSCLVCRPLYSVCCAPLKFTSHGVGNCNFLFLLMKYIVRHNLEKEKSQICVAVISSRHIQFDTIILQMGPDHGDKRDEDGGATCKLGWPRNRVGPMQP